MKITYLHHSGFFRWKPKQRCFCLIIIQRAAEKRISTLPHTPIKQFSSLSPMRMRTIMTDGFFPGQSPPMSASAFL